MNLIFNTLILFVAISSPALKAQESVGAEALKKLEEFRSRLHRWDRMVRGFRREHSFTLSGGAGKGHWELHEPQRGPRRPETESYYSDFQYAFHIPIYQGFGYYLGSSFGTSFEEEEERGDFKVFRSIAFPGLVAGLVLNVTPGFRVNTGLNGHLERVERLSLFDESQSSEKVSITARVLAAQVAFDFFFQLRTGVRFEGVWRRLYYPKPNNLADGAILDTDIYKEERRFGIGLVYHLI